MVGGLKQNDSGLAQTLVDRTGELRVLAASIACFLERDGEKDKALLLPRVEGGNWLIGRGDFIARHLKDELHGLDALAKCLLGLRVCLRGGKLRHEVCLSGQGALALITENGEQVLRGRSEIALWYGRKRGAYILFYAHRSTIG